MIIIRKITVEKTFLARFLDSAKGVFLENFQRFPKSILLLNGCICNYKNLANKNMFKVETYSDYCQTSKRDTPYMSVFSPNGEKHGPEKTPYLDTFQAVIFMVYQTCDAPP